MVVRGTRMNHAPYLWFRQAPEQRRSGGGRAGCGPGPWRRGRRCAVVAPAFDETTDRGNGSWEFLARPFIPSAGPQSKPNVDAAGCFIRRVFKHLQPSAHAAGQCVANAPGREEGVERAYIVAFEKQFGRWPTDDE